MNFSKNVQQWAQDRGLDTADPTRQILKLVEEIGELSGGMARNNVDVIKDSIGDIDVVLEILCLQLGISRSECQALAWDEIKDRKGKMVNGVFIKEGDFK